MPMSNIDVQIIKRIENSPHEVTFVLPAPRPVATGIAPGTAPLSPFTGTDPATGVFVAEPAPYGPSTTVKCLWYDVPTGRELNDRTLEPILMGKIGWVMGATALARVLVSEIANDTDQPYEGTKIDKAEHAEFRGRRYKIVQVVPFSSGLYVPVTYHVWLSGGSV